MQETFWQVVMEQTEGISIPIFLIMAIWGTIIIHIWAVVKGRIGKTPQSVYNEVTYALFWVALCFIYQVTFYNRESGSRNRIVLESFGQLIGKNGYLNLKAFFYMLFNILLFVPVGIIVGMMKVGYPVWKKLIIVTSTSFLISLVVEFSQLITKRGYFETEDLICNTAGGLLGGVFISIICVFIEKMKKRGE